MGKGQGYREDIDWLRAIAVLAVVAFHFEVPGIWGGYVGVDIFFVISGYLITGIVAAETCSGKFSFASFYERRIRRLLPALYTMVALTTLPSFVYLLTSERAEFFRSTAAVVAFTSNSGCRVATSTMPRWRSRCCIRGPSQSKSNSILPFRFCCGPCRV